MPSLDNKVVTHITLSADASAQNKPAHVYAKQYDAHSRYLVVRIVASNKNIDVTSSARLNATKPDGTHSYIKGIVNEDGTITIELDSKLLAVPGVIPCDITIFDSTDENKVFLTTSTFFILVDESNYRADALEGGDYSHPAVQLTISYNNYSEMITILNGATTDTYNIGQIIPIVTPDVPHLWVSGISETSNLYYYINDELFVQELSTNGSVQVGNYILSALSNPNDIDVTTETLKSYVDEKTSGLASEEYVDEKTSDFASVDYVALISDRMLTYAHRYTDEQLEERLFPMATKEEVRNAELSMNLYINGKTSGLASEEYVDEKTSGLASEEYVDEKTSGLASEEYVDEKTSGLASEEYVDEKTSGLASEEYVDEKLNELKNNTSSSNMETTPTEGLVYDIGDDEVTAYCASVGTATDSAIVIASTYQGLPVVAIAAKCFKSCRHITSVTIPKTVTHIMWEAFYDCNNLKTVTIPNSVRYIGDSAFGNCLNLTIYCEAESKPDGWGDYGDGIYESWNSYPCPVVWGYATDTKSINAKIRSLRKVPTVGLKYAADGDEAWCEGIGTITDTDIIIDSEYKSLPVTRITDSAFSECTQLTSVVVPDSVRIIDAMAFYGCTNLKSVTIPKSVTEIFDNAFTQCTALKSIVIPASVITIIDGTFAGCPNLTIYCEAESQPEGWLEGWNADRPVVWGWVNDFEGVNEKLNELEEQISAGVSAEGEGTQNLIYKLGDDSTYYICTGSSRKESYVNIPAYYNGLPVTEIQDGAFDSDEFLTCLSLPDTITYIGARAFSDCTNLKHVKFPNSQNFYAGSAGVEIGYGAFENCEDLGSIDLSRTNVEFFPECMFHNCEGLESVIMPDTLTSIWAYAFEGCVSLADVALGKNLKYISQGAFRYCNCLTSLMLPNGVTFIGDTAFGDCSNLRAITIPKSVNTIEAFAFEQCSNIMIYCEHASNNIPDGWVENWNCGCPVRWNAKLDIPGINEKFLATDDTFLDVWNDNVDLANRVGQIDTALDRIIEIQNSLIGGQTE